MPENEAAMKIMKELDASSINTGSDSGSVRTEGAGLKQDSPETKVFIG